MDSLHAIGFYVSATLSGGGALLVALLHDQTRRSLAMAAVGVGLAGTLLSLSAGFAAAVLLVCYLAIAALTAGRRYSIAARTGNDLPRQLGALGAAALLVALAYAAYNGDFIHSSFYGGAFNAAAVGRLLFTHDAPATVAIAGIALAALVGAATAWRRRERSR